MSVLLDVLRELRSMFIADSRMTAAVVALVCLAGLLAGIGLPAAIVGGLLVVGAPALVVASVLGGARRR